jgi:hypothetical protein
MRLFKRTSKTRQVDLVAALLLTSHLTVQTANLGYRIRSMTSRVSELRRLGLPIRAEHATTIDGQRYRRYHAARGYRKAFGDLVKANVLNKVKV